MKTILLKSILFLSFTITVTLSNAQTKKSIELVEPNAEVQLTVETPVQSTEATNFTHSHLLMKEIPARKQAFAEANIIPFAEAKGGIRGSEIIGEGQYLNYDKVIMQRLISGKIPADFPKHVKGQPEGQYQLLILDWARNNKKLIKKEYYHEIK